MNLLNRIDKLEKAIAPISTDGTCQCHNGVIVEYRDMTEGGTYQETEEQPVFCETCKRERRRIIVELVDSAYKPLPGESIATFNIATNPIGDQP